MRNITRLMALLVPALMVSACTLTGKENNSKEAGHVPDPLEIGYSVSVKQATPEKLTRAKEAGIDFIELGGLKTFVDDDRKFLVSDQEIAERLQAVKAAADEAGIVIWSVHMPFGPGIDLSLADEQERREVVAMHTRLLGLLEIIKPKIILFHPSYYLGLNERGLRTGQLIKSATELDEQVRAINASMVIENMLGYELLRDENRERPLLRTVEETRSVFAQLPETIGLAVDMNHIARPEELIRAMGDRLKTVHIADGTGKEEKHWFPCSGEGMNDWVDILAALDEVGYSGPFMYECKYKDEEALVACYRSLYAGFVEERYPQDLDK